MVIHKTLDLGLQGQSLSRRNGWKVINDWKLFKPPVTEPVQLS